MILCSTASCNQKKFRSICFRGLWCSGFLATCITDWLYICKVDGSFCLIPIFDMRLHTQWISFPASTMAKYSASVNDSMIIPCSFEDQDIAPVSILMRYLLVDLLLLLHSLWSALENKWLIGCCIGLVSECVLVVPFRYWSRCLTMLQ